MFGKECKNCGNIHSVNDLQYHKDLDMYFCNDSCEFEYIAENCQEHEC